MRNLKRALSLALASVMLIGMMVIGTSAASNFTDADEIVNTEAAAITSGLGIFAGANGEFMPTKPVTRAEMATIIVKMLYGNDFNANPFKGAEKFSDVASYQGGWAEGYVNLCTNLKVLGGYPDGTFKPGQTVTTAEAASMILSALGLNKNLGEWPVGVIAKATEIKLFGKLTLGANDPLTRDDLSVLVLNGLNYSAKGKTSLYVVKASDAADAKTLYEGTDALTALIMQQANKNSVLSYDTVSEGSLGDTVFGLKEGTSKDAFGRESKTWTNGKEGKAKVTYATLAPTPELTYTAETTYGKIASALGFTKAADKITLNVSKNGDDATKVDDVNKSTTTKVGGNGTLIEVYKTDDKTYSVLVIETKVKVLAKGDIVAAKKATATEDAVAGYIKLGDTDDSKTNYDTEAFKAGDVVLYTATAKKIVNVVKAASVSGTVTATATADKYFRVNGEKKVLAANTDKVYTIGTTAGVKVDSSKEYTYYTDNYGYVVAIVEGKPAEVETSYVYVIDTASKAAKTGEGGNLFETDESSAARAQAKVIDLKTGIISVVNLGIVKNTAGKYVYATKTGAASDTEVTDTKPVSDAGIYTYVTLEDGSYVLDEKQTGETVKLNKNKADIGVTNKYAGSATVLTVVEYEMDKDDKNIVAATVTTKTGIANFVNNTTLNGAIVIANNDGLVSSITAVQKKAPADSTVNYAIYKGLGETTSEGTKAAFYVKGEVVEYLLKESVSITANAGDVLDVTLEDGKVKETKPVAVAKDKNATEATGYTVILVDSTYVVAKKDASTLVIYLKSGCQIYDAGADYAAAEIAVDDVIDVYSSATQNSAGVIADATLIVIAK